MAELTPENVDVVVAACQANRDEIAEAFGRVLETTVGLEVKEPDTLSDGRLPDDVAGAALAVVLRIGNGGAALLLPESSGLVPSWCAEPDATAESRLATLAQELGMLLLPETLMPDSYRAARVDDIAAALKRGKLDPSAAVLPLELTADDRQATMPLLWPLSTPAALIEDKEEDEAITESPSAEPAAAAPPQPLTPAADPSSTAGDDQPHAQRRLGVTDLPPYSKSLLRIKVPVVVTLAEKRQRLSQILELGPGSIIQFEKSCEDTLSLDVGRHPVATGEAVKVDDKFGLRITSMILPEERFARVEGPRS